MLTIIFASNLFKFTLIKNWKCGYVVLNAYLNLDILLYIYYLVNIYNLYVHILFII